MTPEVITHPSFFTFTAQGMIQIVVMVGIGWKLLKIFRKVDDNAIRWLWEHDVMWTHHKDNYEVPQYPALRVVERVERILERRRKPRDRKPEETNT